jgi:ribosome biogenesis protein UTP30
LQNLSTALPHIVKKVREDWDNVQSIHIKTSSSASLPIWSCRLDEEEGGRWDGLTRVPIPDDVGEKITRGKKRALESEEESSGKKKKSSSIAKKFAPSSQASRPDPPPTESAPSKGSKQILSAAPAKSSKVREKRQVSESSTKPPTQKPTKVKEKPARAAAVDFFDSDNLEDRPAPSKCSASETPASKKSAGSRPLRGSEDPVSTKPKSQDEKPRETKTILKSSKRVAEPSTTDTPVKEKRVKFAAKLPDSRTKRDKALGLTGKKVRSGGGKGVSAKDRVLGKKVAVK